MHVGAGCPDFYARNSVGPRRFLGLVVKEEVKGVGVSLGGDGRQDEGNTPEMTACLRDDAVGQFVLTEEGIDHLDDGFVRPVDRRYGDHDHLFSGGAVSRGLSYAGPSTSIASRSDWTGSRRNPEVEYRLSNSTKLRVDEAAAPRSSLTLSRAPTAKKCCGSSASSSIKRSAFTSERHSERLVGEWGGGTKTGGRPVMVLSPSSCDIGEGMGVDGEGVGERKRISAAACAAAAALAGPLVEPAAERRSDAMPEVGRGEAEPRSESRRSAGFGMRRVDREARPPVERLAMG
jgi:hypothetical protein